MMQFAMDPSGFPLVAVESLGLEVSWLPTTKLQFECFLCDTADDHFGPRLYDELLSLNPRVSPGQVHHTNYWRAFLTGVKPAETSSYLRWLGAGFRVPTADEWKALWRELSDRPALVLDWNEDLPELQGRRLQLLRQLDECSEVLWKDRSLAEQMFLTGGVVEWLRSGSDESKRWVGMGEAPPGLEGPLLDVSAGEVHEPIEPEGERIACYGLRGVRPLVVP